MLLCECSQASPTSFLIIFVKKKENRKSYCKSKIAQFNQVHYEMVSTKNKNKNKNKKNQEAKNGADVQNGNSVLGVPVLLSLFIRCFM